MKLPAFEKHAFSQTYVTDKPTNYSFYNLLSYVIHNMLTYKTQNHHKTTSITSIYSTLHGK